MDSKAIDFWRPADYSGSLGANTNSFFPRPYFSAEGGKNLQTQSKYVEDASYFRLKNAQLGYTVPSHITKKIFVERARIFVSGENLLTFTKLIKAMEPESVFYYEQYNRPTNYGEGYAYRPSYPISRTFSFGINISF
jgi:hypothetical protein